MKALKYILYSLVIAGVVGLLLYQGFVTKDLESSDTIKGLLVILAAVFGMVKPNKRKIANKKAVYKKAYSEFIQDAFEDDPKLERLFYNAIHDYNRDNPSTALAKLGKLRSQCHRTADLRAVTIFTALCLDEMGLYDQAIREYEAAAAMRPNASVYSNLGLCYQRQGNLEAAEKNYRLSIQADPKNAFAYNNMSAMFFRQAEYTLALEYARKAVEVDNTMPQALSCAALCYGLLGDQENYEKYYRLAVANGYDGRRIQATLQRIQENGL